MKILFCDCMNILDFEEQINNEKFIYQYFRCPFCFHEFMRKTEINWLKLERVDCVGKERKENYD